MEFRQRLGGLVHVSQCPGPPTPTSLRAEELAEERRESDFLARVRASPLAGDLAQAIRDDEEMSRIIHEADCVVYDWDKPDTPRNVAEVRVRLDQSRKQLRDAEAAFDRLAARCPAE